MRAVYHPSFARSLRKFSLEIHKKFQKQLNLLIEDLRHPSLHAKKYNESRGVWQARVDKSIRFYFYIEDDVYVLLDITKHPK